MTADCKTVSNRAFHRILAVLAALTCFMLADLANASARERAKQDDAALRDLLKHTVARASRSGNAWRTDFDYLHRIDDAETVGRAQSGEDTAKARFATLRKSFGEGEVQPFFGLGFGDARTQFRDSAEGEIALRGVVGTDLQLDARVQVFLEYGVAIAPQAETGQTGDSRNHGVAFGFRVRLN